MPVSRMGNLVYTLGLLTLPRKGLAYSYDGKPLSEQAKARITDAMIKRRVVGAQIALILGGSVEGVYTCGLRRKPDTPVMSDTIFRSASLAKVPAALIALRLCERGLLGLDSDVSEYLGYELRNPNFPESKITLRQLLSHTSSICDGTGYARGLSGGLSLRDALLLPDSFTENEPDTAFKYANIGYALVSEIIGNVTKTDYIKAMRSEVFDVLGMEASYDQSVFPESRLSAIYRIFPPSSSASFEPCGRKMPTGETAKFSLAPGNIYTTAADFAKLAEAILTKDERLLSKESYAEMQKPRAEYAEGAAFALGLFSLRRGGRTLYGHQGVAYGAVNGMFISEDDSAGFVIMDNGADERRRGRMTLMCESAIDSVFGAMEDSGWIQKRSL